MHAVRLLLTALALAAVAAPAPAEEGPFAPVQKMLEAAVAKKQVAGGVALVSRKGQVVYHAAVGLRDAEAKKAMTKDAIFRIASMTKPITSAAAMVLVDDGKLAVTDPVSKYLPEFKGMKVLVKREENGKVVLETRDVKRDITVHDLLTHTSGITYRFLNRPVLSGLYVEAGITDGISDTKGTQADNIRKLAKLPLLFGPGERFEYGLNTDVLGRVIEAVSGQTLDAFFRERLFEPLKMKDAHFLVPKEKRGRLAKVYTPGPDGKVRPLGDRPVVDGPLVYGSAYPTRDGSKFFSGGGGLCATAGDYHRFCLMMLNKGELDGKRVLKAETVKKMTTNRLGKIKGMPFGYGFGIAGEPKGPGQSAGSYSWGGFFSTFFWVDPKEEVIGILMFQMHPGPKAPLNADFVKGVYTALKKGEK